MSNHLTHIAEEFKAGAFKLGETIVVDDITFRMLSSSTFPFEDMLRLKKKAFIVYSVHPNKENKEKFAEQEDLKEWIVFIWAVNDSLEIVPVNVKTTSKARGAVTVMGEKEENRDNVIGDVVEVKVTSLPAAHLLKGKVDTGAQMSSMNADEIISMKNNQVTFKSSVLSPNTITMELQDQQAIKSADGGTEYRPVISLNVKVGDKLLTDVSFNLNDRRNMEYPVLIGQNILQKGKFLIDPNMVGEEVEETVDWQALQEEFGDLYPEDKEWIEITALLDFISSQNKKDIEEEK